MVSLEIPNQVAEKLLVACAKRLFLTLIFRKNHVGKRLTNSHQEFKRDTQVRDNGFQLGTLPARQRETTACQSDHLSSSPNMVSADIPRMS